MVMMLLVLGYAQWRQAIFLAIIFLNSKFPPSKRTPMYVMTLCMRTVLSLSVKKHSSD
jgi:hypothetical protein